MTLAQQIVFKLLNQDYLGTCQSQAHPLYDQEGSCFANSEVELFLLLQRSRGLSRSPSNYEEFVWKRYFPMSEWDQNRTRSSVAIDINTRLSLVAIMYPLWLPRSHNMADFHAFLTYFSHLFHTAVRVIIKMGTCWALNLRYT